ncbi:MAG: type I glyceraldehyde-3-phosphate dehydrogenase [Candidatus Saccharibacteria bacterium]|nr:type I glyceraldehyde-3-phosphate dehydrogenase [Candidatus Saccharibacteria bacterium]
MVKVAINGFGRIGRNALKILLERHDVQVVAINDLTDAKTLAHLLKHDSSYGEYDKKVSSTEDSIMVNSREIKVFAEKDPENLPWKKLDVDVVIESTGFFTKPEDAAKHLKAGAKKVVISAPAKGEEIKTVVLGVNEEVVEKTDKIISNASCTTNCIAPIMKVLENTYGVEKAMMTTVHSYTGSQRVLDAPSKDLREGRTAAQNIIPTSTGASKAAALTIPSLKGKFNGLSIRVPTPVVSLADITAILKQNVEKEELQKLFKKVSKDPYYEGILGVTEEELVSSDFIGNPNSCIVDLPLIDVVGGNMIKIVAWYDNEWGYSNRLVELTVDFGKDN